MSIFGLFGADGLPPLGGAGICQTPGCGRLVSSGRPLCGICMLRGISAAVFGAAEASEAGETTERQTDIHPVVSQAASSVEAEAIRELAAPRFQDSWLDPRCPWCRRIIRERPDRYVSEATPAERVECERHQTRRRAHGEILDMITMLQVKHGATTEEIAEYYRYGYLGDRLTDEFRF